MSIKTWFVTGDCHGDVSRFINQPQFAEGLNPEEVGIIILGDAGINFFLDGSDAKRKKKLQDTKYNYYLLRGNHKQRPELLPDIHMRLDTEIRGLVWMQDEFPNIKYLIDGQDYHFGQYTALCIGGAYSIDKWYRLSKAGITDTADFAQLCAAGWFPHEQLNDLERRAIMNQLQRKASSTTYNFVLTHTCPFSWQPVDLFLQAVDQSKVDNTMEKWLEEIKNSINWNLWLFGHFHRDRIERPHVEQLYKDVVSLDSIYNRWYGEKTFKDEWWKEKAPAFYQKGDTPYD